MSFVLSKKFHVWMDIPQKNFITHTKNELLLVCNLSYFKKVLGPPTGWQLVLIVESAFGPGAPDTAGSENGWMVRFGHFKYEFMRVVCHCKVNIWIMNHSAEWLSNLKYFKLLYFIYMFLSFMISFMLPSEDIFFLYCSMSSLFSVLTSLL